jgi:hypothetical protein
VRPRHLNTIRILKQVPDQRPSTTGLQETSFYTNLHKVFTCCCSPCPTKSFSSSIYSFKPHFLLFFSAAITIFKIVAVYQTPYSSEETSISICTPRSLSSWLQSVPRWLARLSHTDVGGIAGRETSGVTDRRSMIHFGEDLPESFPLQQNGAMELPQAVSRSPA